MSRFPIESLSEKLDRLNAHPVYARLKSSEDLQVFMTHHVFSVWDFMSLVKTLQASIAPTRAPWAPVGDPLVRRFINEIVLEEESDQGIPESGKTPEFISHFELYTHAMEEIGAEPSVVRAFVEDAFENGIDAALNSHAVPEAAAAFVRQTFAFIETGKPHVIAAAFALGREHIIPAMFRQFLGQSGITAEQAPAFHYYLERHIHLDEDFHGPLSMRMLDLFIGDDDTKRQEALDAANAAIDARLNFWDGVNAALDAVKNEAA